MSQQSNSGRSYRLSVTEHGGTPDPDACRLTEGRIREVVDEFYRRAQRDDQLGPVFEAHVESWDRHLAKMVDFWSAAMLRTGRYSGNPIQRHREIPELTLEHFDRWVALFEATVHDRCEADEAEAFLVRVRKMHYAMTQLLRLSDDATRPGIVAG